MGASLHDGGNGKGLVVKKTFEVTIFNHKFFLKSDEDERYVQRVADFLNKKLFEIQEKTKSVSSLNVALLAALNIADDLFKIRFEKKGKADKAKNKVKELIHLVDRYIQD